MPGKTPVDRLLDLMPKPDDFHAEWHALAKLSLDEYRADLLNERDDSEDNLAYDGSNYEPLRALSARERDILCRILGDILSDIRRTGGVNAMRAVGLCPGDVRNLLVMRAVLNPRRDIPAFDSVDHSKCPERFHHAAPRYDDVEYAPMRIVRRKKRDVMVCGGCAKPVLFCSLNGRYTHVDPALRVGCDD